MRKTAVLPFQQGSNRQNNKNRKKLPNFRPFSCMNTRNHRNAFLNRNVSRSSSYNSYHNSVNGSVLSFGVELTNTGTGRDLFEAIKQGHLTTVNNLLQLKYYQEVINYPDEENGLTAMHYAAQYNRKNIIDSLIQYGGDVNARGKDNMVPLHLAAKYDSVEAAVALIQYGADVSLDAKDNLNPVHYSSQFGSNRVMEVMLDSAKKSNIVNKVVNHPDSEDYYPIHLAVFYCDRSTTDILIKYGADIYKKNCNGMLATHGAVMRKRLDVLDALLQHAQFDKRTDYVMISNNDGVTILHLAAEYGSIEVVNICLQYGADIEVKTYELYTALHIAAMSSHCQLAEYLIEKGADIDAKDNEGKTCLHHAALSNNTTLIDIAVRHGANIEAQDTNHHTPLLAAIWKGCTRAAKRLLLLKADIMAADLNGRHGIHYVAEQRDSATLKVILENGGSDLVNRPDNHGILPIFIAGENGASDVLYTLVENNGKLDVSDEKGNTLLHIAAKNNHRDTVKYIVDSTESKDVNLRNEFGQKPIHLAAEYGHDRVINYLIKSGADINHKDIFTYSPLHYAAQGGYTSTAQIFISKRAKVNVTDRSGNTPLHQACANGHLETVKFLLANDADPTMVNTRGLNCLDKAIENDQTDIGLEIIRSKSWEKVMENREYDGYTPMKRLLEKLPNVALAVMDRCITYTTEIDGDISQKVTFNFTYLESPPTNKTLKDVQDNYIAVSSILKSDSLELMTHPLIRAYRHYKWNSYLKFLYYGKLLFDLLFVLSILIPVGVDVRDYYNLVYNTTGTFQDIPNKPVQLVTGGTYMRHLIMVISVILGTVGRLFVTVVSGSQKKFMFKHFSTSILEICIKILVLVTFIPINRPVTNITIQLSAVIVFMTVIDFLTKLNRAFGVGLYLTMFMTIIKTIARASVVILLFLFAFAISFYMVLRQLPEFNDFGHAIIRVLTMMVGDIGYQGTYQYLFAANQLQTTGAAVVLAVLFIIFMNIAFANLLVGLAVGDINEVRKDADLNLIQLDLSFITAATSLKLPFCFRNHAYRPSLIIRNCQEFKLFKKFEWKKLTADMDLTSAEFKMKDQDNENKDMYDQIRYLRLDIKANNNRFDDFRSDVFRQLTRAYRTIEEMKADINTLRQSNIDQSTKLNDDDNFE